MALDSGISRSWVARSVPRLLGNLARLRGDADLARDCYREAVSLGERTGERATLALAKKALAGIEGAASVTVVSRRRAGSSPPPRLISLAREGEVWAIDGGAGPLRVKQSKGVAYLSELVARPHHEVHVLQLIGVDASTGDAGPVLDERAKAEYRERLAALDEELANAEALGDGPRGEPIRTGPARSVFTRDPDGNVLEFRELNV